jgi:Ni/Co efflux regulator RcnB
MKKAPWIVLAAGGLVMALLPGSSAAPFAPQERHEAQEHRGEYHFRQEDGAKLRQHYKNIEHVDVSHRPQYVAGGRLPADWHHRLHPVPAAIIRELPPPPPGYVFGYMDGYCVVYDPTTLLIADVIDLATLAH